MKHIDKLYHFAVCMVTMAVLAAWMMPFPLAVIITFFLAFGKELYDRSSYGHFCWYDILADAIGCIVGALIAIWIGVANWGF